MKQVKEEYSGLKVNYFDQQKKLPESQMVPNCVSGEIILL